MAAAFDRAVETFGTLDVLMNNAGVDASGTHVADLATEVFDTAMRTNVYGTFFCCRRFIQERKKHAGGGKIINVTSVHEDIPNAGGADYDCSKGAIRNLTRALALELAPDDGSVGVLAAWQADDEPHPGAVKIDPRSIDADGDAAWASLVLAPRGTWLLFDDVAVSHAIRSVLAGAPVDVVSTFVTGDDRFVGAITAVHDDEPTRLRDDPFAAIFPTRLVRVGPGLLGRTPTPVGPMTQRYGAANPWPWDRFPEARV